MKTRISIQQAHQFVVQIEAALGNYIHNNQADARMKVAGTFRGEGGAFIGTILIAGTDNFDRSDRLTAVLPRLEEALPATDFEHIKQLERTRYLFEQVTSIEDAGEQRRRRREHESEQSGMVSWSGDERSVVSELQNRAVRLPK